MPSQLTGVMLMAYGTPKNLDEVAPYYRSIRGSREPKKEEIDELRERYRKIGGSTPLLKITQKVAKSLEMELNSAGTGKYRGYEGMKHWHPFIAETVSKMAKDGVNQIVALPMAPHYSQMSIDGYKAAVSEAVGALPKPVPVRFIESWYQNPLFISVMAQRVKETLESTFGRGAAKKVEVIFSAHSLPRRIQKWDDPYPKELLQSSEAVAKAANLTFWRFSYQSASHTGEPWLGPDILETLSDLARQNKLKVLSVPIGFMTDNLEILYDIDAEAQELAKGLGMTLKRIEMMNDSPAFVKTLANIVLTGEGARASSF